MECSHIFTHTHHLDLFSWLPGHAASSLVSHTWHMLACPTRQLTATSSSTLVHFVCRWHRFVRFLLLFPDYPVGWRIHFFASAFFLLFPSFFLFFFVSSQLLAQVTGNICFSSCCCNCKNFWQFGKFIFCVHFSFTNTHTNTRTYKYKQVGCICCCIANSYCCCSLFFRLFALAFIIIIAVCC